MPVDSVPRLPAVAEVVLRVGLNLQPGQPLLITDPYDLMGVHPDALPLAEAVSAAAGPARTTFKLSDPTQLRQLAADPNSAGYGQLVSRHARDLQRHVAAGGASLFLTGSAPALFAGLPAARLAELEQLKWRSLAPVIRQLVGGASQWTLLPAPTRDWAAFSGTDLPTLWSTLHSALRLDEVDPVSAWQQHIAGLRSQCAELNRRRHRQIRYHGPETDLVLDLPRSHRWCTAELLAPGGISFLANLPSEEVFTAPHKASATGRVRVSPPVAHNGVILEGIALEFNGGRVVRASARVGEPYLHQLLATDAGASQVGEVAVVPDGATLPWAGRVHGNTILDENAGNHLALGDAYRFCSRAWWPLALNRSALHLDLPLAAAAEFS